MARLRLTGTEDSSTNRQPPPTLRFPIELARRRNPGTPAVAEDVLAALEEVSRKMEDLARSLGCLGHFDDDDDDRPRAA
jgi:hypothetical protein